MSLEVRGVTGWGTPRQVSSVSHAPLGAGGAAVAAAAAGVLPPTRRWDKSTEDNGAETEETNPPLRAQSTRDHQLGS